MTVTANRETRVITSNTGFANPIELDQYVEQTGHIKVYADDIELTPGVDYLIDTVLPADGVEISITATGLLYDPVDWIVLHDPPMSQEADLSLGGRFGLAYEQAIDALARRLQTMNDKVTRGLRLPVNTPLDVEGGEFPSPQANAIVGWNAAATALENKGTVPQLIEIAAIAAQITAVSEKLAEIEAVADSQANIDTLAALNAQITSLGAIATELAELALVESELLDLHGELTMLTALYGSLTQLLAVHSQLADIAAVAGIDGEITALASLAATELPAIYAALGDIHAAVADLPSLAAKLNKDGSNIGDDTAKAAFRAAIQAAKLVSISVKSVDYTVTVDDADVLLVMDTAAKTFSLPDISTVASGQQFHLKNSSTGIVTIAADGSDTIEDAVTGTPAGSFVLTAGRGGTLAKMDGVWRWVGPQPQRIYVSADQSITAGGLLTLAHGLGVPPLLIQRELVCVTAEVGYSVGDAVIDIMGPYKAEVPGSGTAVTWTSTNVLVRYGSQTVPLYVLHKSTGVLASITLANWRYRIKAFA